VILVLTNSQDATADYLCPILQESGLVVCRFNTDSPRDNFAISSDLTVEPIWRFPHAELVPEAVHHVWLRRPLPLASGGQTAAEQHAAYEWASAIEGFLNRVPTARWMNHPAVNTTASHKIDQLYRAREVGFAIPRSLITQVSSDAICFWHRCHGRVVAKPLSFGYVEGATRADDFIIYTSSVSLDDIQGHSELLAKTPTLFQERIDKECDVRVTVIDDEATAIALVAKDHNQIDIRRNEMREVQYRPIEIPSVELRRIFTLVRGYGLRFAALDFAVTREGAWVFFELNPNGQWAWMDIEGCCSIHQSFLHAFKRLNA
jgi:hypothetical protein